MTAAPQSHARSVHLTARKIALDAALIRARHQKDGRLYTAVHRERAQVLRAIAKAAQS